MPRQCQFPVRLTDSRGCYRSTSPCFICLVTLLAMLLGYAGFSQAETEGVRAETSREPDIRTLRKQLEIHAKALAEQQKQLDAEFQTLESHRRALAATQRQLESLQAQLGMPVELNPQRVSQAEQIELSGRGPDNVGPGNTLDVATVFSQPSILTPQGKFIFEPALSYSFSSSDRVNIVGYSILPALVIGLIDVRTVSRSTWIATLGGRYGLTPRLELEARVPYLYRSDDTLSRPINLTPSALDRVFGAEGHGLGDIEFAARYQLNIPKGDDPFYVAGLRLKTRTGKDPFEVEYATGSTATTYGSLQTELPTGSGFYSLQASLSAVLPTDPAVFFGGINYLFNMKRDVNQQVGGATGTFVGEVDPGDSVGINLGMGLSLNEKSAFSLGYEHTWIGKTKNDGVTPPTAVSTQLASWLLGYSYRLNKTTNLNVSIAAGLTNDTPDTQITVRVPIRF